MEIIGARGLLDDPVGLSACRVHAGGAVERVRNDVQQEHLLEVYVNDVLTFQVGCSPSYLDELVIGRMLTEGLVSSADEIRTVYLCDQALRARVYLQGREAVLSNRSVESVQTCCTNNKTLNRFFDKGEPLAPVVPREVVAAEVLAAAEAFYGDRTMRDVTHGSHSAFLAQDGEILCMREDIGRHNAVDKAVGWALVEGVDLSRCLLFSTGRMPTDMVRKAIRAGVFAMASKSAATDKAIELAQEFSLALITNLTPESFDIVTA